MGDRGNIFFVDRPISESEWAGIYMYTHWAGASLPQIVQEALIRGRGRWGDAQYLSRIMFCELIKDNVLGDTGFGLGTFMGDNNRLVIQVNDVDQTVSYCEPGGERDRALEQMATWTYEEFLTADIWDEW